MLRLSTIALAATSGGGYAMAQEAPSAKPHAVQQGGFEQVIVTAQRRATKAQKTPVSVAVLDSKQLQRQAVHTQADLEYSVPGLLVRESLNGNQQNFAIRGQSIDAFTGSQPAVQPYIDEVPVTGLVASSYFDLASIQALKGPQGTLFGRNTTGGAVLYTTAPPTNGYSGYVDTRLGDYGQKEVQGAVNLPLIPDKLMVRIAADGDWRDGFTRNLFNNSTVGDVNRKGVRVSITAKPTDTITNTLVVDYERETGSANPDVLYYVSPVGATNGGQPVNDTGTIFFSPLLDSVFGPGSYAKYLAANPGAYPPGVLPYLAVQRQRGPYVVDLNGQPATNASSWLFSNITAWQVSPDVTIRNIFGYVRARDNESNTDWDGSPFLLENTGPNGNDNADRQYSEELQVQGKAFGGDLNYVAGGYFESDQIYQLLNVSFFGLTPVYSAHSVFATQYNNNSYAAYGQGTYKLDRLGLKNWSVTAGLRFTHYDSSNTELPGSLYYDTPYTANTVQQGSSQVSYQFGIQDQVNPHLLVYGVTRRSFRNGGFTPSGPQVFEDSAAEGGNEFMPEIIYDVEVGEKFQKVLDNIPVRLNVALFNSWINNVQRSDYVTSPIFGISGLTANVPEAIVQGFEVESQVSPVDWLNLGVNMSYDYAHFNNNGVDLLGAPSRYGPYPDTPRWSGSAFAQVSYPMPNPWFGTFAFRTDVFAQSAFFFGSLNNTVEPGTKIPGYGLTNFRVAFENIANRPLTVAFYLKNAFNKVYWVGGIPTSGVYSTNAAVAGDPRTWYFELTYKF